MTFIYDFGDEWSVYVSLDKMTEDKCITPIVTAGKGFGIVENCGGACNLEKSLQEINHANRSLDLNIFE